MVFSVYQAADTKHIVGEKLLSATSVVVNSKGCIYYSTSSAVTEST